MITGLGLSLLLLIVGIGAYVLSTKTTVEIKKYLLLFMSLLLILGGAYSVVRTIQTSVFDIQLNKLQKQLVESEAESKKLQTKVQKYEDEREQLLLELDALNKEYTLIVKKHEQNEKDLRARLEAIQNEFKPVHVAPEEARKFLLEMIRQQEEAEKQIQQEGGQ